jgi:hypothetical protein
MVTKAIASSVARRASNIARGSYFPVTANGALLAHEQWGSAAVLYDARVEPGIANFAVAKVAAVSSCLSTLVMRRSNRVDSIPSCSSHTSRPVLNTRQLDSLCCSAGIVTANMSKRQMQNRLQLMVGCEQLAIARDSVFVRHRSFARCEVRHSLCRLTDDR